MIKLVTCIVLVILISVPTVLSGSGETLRHITVPYANFNTGSQSGFSVEMIQLFCEIEGYEYEYTQTCWDSVFINLRGVDEDNNNTSYPIKGDLISSGLTILEWRKEIVNFSYPVFPTQVWLIVKADSPITPIIPSGNIDDDIILTKEKLKNVKLLSKKSTCLDPDLYNLDRTGSIIGEFEGTLNMIAPALINGDTEAILLDVPDALVALGQWPGDIKIIGPISKQQEMAVAFRKTDKKRLQEFNKFLKTIKENGYYMKLINKYYPEATCYFPEFFMNYKTK